MIEKLPNSRLVFKDLDSVQIAIKIIVLDKHVVLAILDILVLFYIIKLQTVNR